MFRSPLPVCVCFVAVLDSTWSTNGPMMGPARGFTLHQAILLGGASLLLIFIAILFTCVAYHCAMRRRLYRLQRHQARPVDNVELAAVSQATRRASLRRNHNSGDALVDDDNAVADANVQLL